MLKISSTFLMVLVIVSLSGCNTGYVKTTAAVLSAAGVKEADFINNCTDRKNVDSCLASTISYAAERGREENARVQQARVYQTSNGSSDSTVCIYNDSGRDLNFTVKWNNGACTNYIAKVENNNFNWFSCKRGESPMLILQWTGYKEESFYFEGFTINQGQCVYGNSIRIAKTEFGYKWNVYKGQAQ